MTVKGHKKTIPISISKIKNFGARKMTVNPRFKDSSPVPQSRFNEIEFGMSDQINTAKIMPNGTMQLPKIVEKKEPNTVKKTYMKANFTPLKGRFDKRVYFEENWED